MQSSVEPRGRAGRLLGVTLAITVVLVAAWRTGLFALHDREQLALAIERVRGVPYVAAAFVATYAVAAAFGVPATPFTLAGGALFGVVWGTALNWIGEMLAAALAFAAARATGVRARTGGATGGATALLHGARGARMLFRLRLVPVAPFALLNAGAAVAGMGWRDYLVATALGILPITIIYTMSASALVAGVAGSGARALLLALASGAVLITLSFLPSITRMLARRAP